MFKKQFAILASLFILLVFGVFSSAHAQVQQDVLRIVEPEGVPLPFYPTPASKPTLPSFLGQEHDYSVFFRGNGEAVVNFKVVLTNDGNNAMKRVNLRAPKNLSPRDFSVYQILRNESCVRYKPLPTRPLEIFSLTPGDDSSSSGLIAEDAIPSYPSRRECEEYSRPDYFQSYYSDAKFQKAEHSFSGDSLEITLPKEIRPGATGAYVVYYRAFGYAKRNIFGAYNFDFETFKVDDAIKSLDVGINTGNDIFLKGVAKGSVNYRFDQKAYDGLESSSSLGVGAVSNTRYNDSLRQIGRGSVTKSTSNLAELESYHVKGKYASSRLKLYSEYVFWGIIAIVVFFGVVFFLVRRIFRRLRSRQKEVVEAAKDTKENNTADAKAQLMMFSTNLTNALLTTGVSFLSSVLIAGYTISLVYIGPFVTYYVGYDFQFVWVLFLVVISIGLYCLLGFAPPLYVGVKKGIGWGILTLVQTLAWLLVFLFIGVIFGSIASGLPTTPRFY